VNNKELAYPEESGVRHDAGGLKLLKGIKSSWKRGFMALSGLTDVYRPTLQD
jgi:hypothetical protein